MYTLMKQVNNTPDPFEFYTAQALWDDDYISKQMLELHLTPDSDLASRTQSFTDRSIRWISQRFDIGKGVSLADFGCGPGLYTTAFARRGARVTGIDFSKRSIAYAVEQAADQNLPIEYIRKNYLEFDSPDKFDLITLIYCDFCPLSPDQRQRLLHCFHRHLTDGGYLLFDVCSEAAFAKIKASMTFEHRLLNGFWSANDYYGFLKTIRYEDNMLGLDKYTIVEASGVWSIYNWMQYFSLASVTRELELCGFKVESVYADVAGKPYGEDSDTMAIVAKKK